MHAWRPEGASNVITMWGLGRAIEVEYVPNVSRTDKLYPPLLHE
jgi:hypothetical protein